MQIEFDVDSKVLLSRRIGKCSRCSKASEPRSASRYLSEKKRTKFEKRGQLREDRLALLLDRVSSDRTGALVGLGMHDDDGERHPRGT